MPYQDLSVGSTSSSSSSSSTSGLGARQNTSNNNNDGGGSWWDSVRSYFSDSGGDSSNVSSPEESSNNANTVNFSDDDDNTNAAASIYDEPEMTYEPEVYAAIADAGKASVFYTPDDILQEAYEGDMAGKGEDKPDPLGNMGVPGVILKDVTDTDEGALSNPDALYKLAEDIRENKIQTTVLDDQGKPLVDFNKITNIQDVRSKLDGETDPDKMLSIIKDALEESTVVDLSPPEAGDQALVPTTETVEAVEPVEKTGLMSRRLDGKDGTIATKQYTLSKTDLEEQAKAMFPNNPTAMGAFIATVNAESAGGKDMVENGYSKVRAIQKFVNPYKKKDGTLGPKMKARKKAIEESKSAEEIFEIVYGSGYTGNKNLGNTEIGDGFRFIGRGPIQLTGRANYEKYGNRVGVDLVNNPELMATDQKVSLAVTREYLKDKGLDKVKTANDLWRVIGHADDAKQTKAKARWKEAQKIANRFRRSTSPRPMLRPTN